MHMFLVLWGLAAGAVILLLHTTVKVCTSSEKAMPGLACPLAQHALSVGLRCLQVLDHLLLLLDDGTLMLLKYSQVVQRFYIAAELQLAAGGSTYLTWKLASVLCNVSKLVGNAQVSWCTLVFLSAMLQGQVCVWLEGEFPASAGVPSDGRQKPTWASCRCCTLQVPRLTQTILAPA